jgi:hypothetical protein
MRQDVAICLDEIDACYDKLEKGGISEKAQKKLRGWVRKQKEMLKSLEYKGKIRRLKMRKGG